MKKRSNALVQFGISHFNIICSRTLLVNNAKVVTSSISTFFLNVFINIGGKFESKVKYKVNLLLNFES